MAKRLVAFCFGVCALTCVSGQSYYPFPMDSAYWSVAETFWAQFPEPNGCITKHYGLFLDSLSNGESYSTLYGNNVSGLPYEDTAFNFQTASGLAQVKQDTAGRIWVDGMLYYDFSLGEGDTFCFDYFPTVGCYWVDFVDSVLIDGNYRKRITFYTGNSESWIEGIGSTTGWLQWQWVGSWSWSLTCYREKDRVIYGSAGKCHCNTYTGINGRDFRKKIIIRTDPSTANLEILLPEKRNESFIKLYSLDGRAVEQWFTTQSHTYFDISHLPQGIYLVVVQGQDGIAARKQVVKLSP